MKKSDEIEPLLLSILDSCRVLGIGRSKMYQLIERGIIDSVHIDGSHRVVVASLKRLASSNSKEAM